MYHWEAITQFVNNTGIAHWFSWGNLGRIALSMVYYETMGKGISYSVEQTLVGGNKSPQDVCEGGYMKWDWIVLICNVILFRQAKILCTNICKCTGCKNFEESPERKTLMHLADAAGKDDSIILSVKTDARPVGKFCAVWGKYCAILLHAIEISTRAYPSNPSKKHYQSNPTLFFLRLFII